MRKRERTHNIELIFTVSLFYVFLISAILVIVIGANVYRGIQQTSEENYGMRTSLAYVMEKIRQGDAEGSVTVGSLDDGTQAILLSSTYNDVSYTTYIYTCENEMRELFLKDGSSSAAADGTVLIQDVSLSFEETEDGIIQVTATDSEGSVSSVMIHPSAGEEGEA